MADNITFQTTAATPPDGTIVATDETAQGHAQIIKLAYSANGSATLVTADADGILVNLGANNDVTLAGTVTVADGGSSISVDDNGSTLSVDDGGSTLSIDDGAGSLTVDGTVAVTHSTLAVVGGGTEATALRVTVATDSTGVLSVDDNGGSLTVDGTVGVSGTVAVTQSGTWDEIGINDSGNSITVDNPILSIVGGGTEAAAQRVTIATDSTGVLSVDDNGGSLTVDGSVVSLGDLASNDPDSATGPVVKVGGIADVTLPSYTSGDRAHLSMGTRGSLHVELYNTNSATALFAAAVAEADGTANVTTTQVRSDMFGFNGTTWDRLRSDTTNGLDVDVTRVIPGTVATALGKAEDAAHTTADTGVAMLAVRRDTAAVGSDTDGDYSTINVNASGRLYTSATVDAALPAGNNNIGDVDVASIVPGTAATNLGKAEDAAHSSGDVGVMALAVRSDAGTVTAADGDYLPLLVNASGALYVTGGGGGTEYVEDAAAAADPTGTVQILVRKDTPSATVTTDGDNVAQRGSNFGAAYVTLVDSSGNFVSPGGGTQYTEDGASAGGESLTLAGGVRRDTAASSATTDGDYATLNLSATGRLYTDASVTSLPASTNTLEVVGDVAEDVALAGNPVRIGVRASTATPSAMSADGDVITPWASREGAQVMTWNEVKIAGLTPTIDTAVYADLDRLGSVVTVTGAALRNGGSGMIVGAQLIDDAVSNFSIEAHFFQVTPTMANADNGVFDLTDANIATAVWLGCIDFWSANSKSWTTNRVCQGTYLGGPPAMRYTCASGDSAIYMILRARGAYDAAATDDLVIHLNVVRF